MATLSAQERLRPEDSLRLHVLLAGQAESLHAIRIDESRDTLHALTDAGEISLTLHPSGPREAYFAAVREILGGFALDSPGGYPVYLQRWTRMGQQGGSKLARLLLLGEPEAVVAVAHAPALSDELAARVWWALPEAEVARVMLGHESVARGRMGVPLAEFLVEHLPFEQDPDMAMHTVRVILAANLEQPALESRLWAAARREPHLYLGFLEFRADALPADGSPRSASPPPNPAATNPWQQQLDRCRSPAGRAFFQAAQALLERPQTSGVVYGALEALARYSAPLGERLPDAPLDRLHDRATERIRTARDEASALGAFLQAGGSEDSARALLQLASLGAETAAPYLARRTTVGAQMRRQMDELVCGLNALFALVGPPGKSGS